MNSLVYLALVVFLFNVAPAFAPPTWSVLVFFSLNFDINPIALITIGAMCAGTGRYVLARVTKHLRRFISGTALTNLESAQMLLNQKRSHKVAVMLLFIVSPLPSAQLFEAAGLMGARLLPLTLAFFSGRIVTYSLYVASANELKSGGLDEIIKREFTSLGSIIFQLLMILGIIMLTRVNWFHRFSK